MIKRTDRRRNDKTNLHSTRSIQLRLKKPIWPRDTWMLGSESRQRGTVSPMPGAEEAPAAIAEMSRMRSAAMSSVDHGSYTMAAPDQTHRRTYLDRMGRVITDPETIEARAMLQQLRRLETVNRKRGNPWDRAVTVAELAKAAKLSTERVVAIVRRFAPPWSLCLIEAGPEIGAWGVFQDGE